jgi:hypothetical protein
MKLEPMATGLTERAERKMHGILSFLREGDPKAFDRMAEILRLEDERAAPAIRHCDDCGFYHTELKQFDPFLLLCPDCIKTRENEKKTAENEAECQRILDGIISLQKIRKSCGEIQCLAKKMQEAL